MSIKIFLFEFTHFIRSKAKLFSYLFFMILCVFSIYNGWKIMHEQKDTILEINDKQDTEISNIEDWFNSGVKGPEDKPWINIEDPYSLIRSTPSYVVKDPSPLLPLGIGQSQQFGFYKKVNRWSSTYDSDMVEEISNYERLINGSIDLSFLIIFLLPILIIILTYNINGLEKDLKFSKLVNTQINNINFWVLNRLTFYAVLLVLSIDALILSVGFLSVGPSDIKPVLDLILISNIYIISIFIIFYFIISNGVSSNSIAFKMISMWLLFCIIIPGSVHQYVSMKYPVNYMTDFLDVNRKEIDDLFELEDTVLYNKTLQIHPDLQEHIDSSGKVISSQQIRRSISTIANQMNISVTNNIEIQNENKNKIIRFSYFFNPVSYVQNIWNSCTATDYYAYRNYRKKIQRAINRRNDKIVSELWQGNKVDKKTFNKEYLLILSVE